MKVFTDKEIAAEVLRIFPNTDYTKYEVKVVTNTPELITIELKRMYEYVEYNLEQLMKLAHFLNTMNINDERYAYDGCETCDYGSSYEVTFHIRPDGTK